MAALKCPVKWEALPFLKSGVRELQFYMLGAYVSKRENIPKALVGRKGLGHRGAQLCSGAVGSTAGTS